VHLDVELIRKLDGSLGKEHGEWLGCDGAKRDASERFGRRGFEKGDPAAARETLRPDV
jgi:hypothetical protein